MRYARSSGARKRRGAAPCSPRRLASRAAADPAPERRLAERLLGAGRVLRIASGIAFRPLLHQGRHSILALWRRRAQRGCAQQSPPALRSQRRPRCLARRQFAVASRIRCAGGGKAAAHNDVYECEFVDDAARWSAVHVVNAPPPPRARHAAVAVDDRFMLVFGGVDKRRRFNDVWVYDSQSRSWTEVAVAGHALGDEAGGSVAVAPGPRAHFSVCKLFDKLLIFGGYGGAGVVYGDLWALHMAREGDRFDLRCTFRASTAGRAARLTVVRRLARRRRLGLRQGNIVAPAGGSCYSPRARRPSRAWTTQP